MVVIRLSRAGAKGQPFYYLVVQDSRAARDGRYIEQVGFFNPIARGKDEVLRLQRERVQYWLDCGAQLSDRVRNLVKDFDKAAVKAA
jgi:small subunit ribosomal protein S16